MADRLDGLHGLARTWGIEVVERVGSGSEFSVYGGYDRTGTPLVLRIAHRVIDANANDPRRPRPRRLVHPDRTASL